ncbi:cyclase family protein [Paenibacillus sp. HN-1]|uniref:cyclase family protein n=1 Tax=Paenibacillus TaxID=44249 RepID=UPI001CA9F56B|nr:MULTISPECIES: cyclase family protein [Paenibacillus]MBY9077386.1 cyclase family protein [Paenibacillus sp. CGMCC 1.18879]MBY9087506.1 cyclase family protein [Paenibacillus sinensis]
MRTAYEIIDLSIAFHKNMPKYEAAWFPEFSYEEIRPENLTDNTWKRRFTKVNLFAHNGTHVEVSDHVFSDGNTLGQHQLERFLGFPWIVDLTDVPEGMPISYEKVYERMKDKLIRKNDILLLKTLYNDKHWGAASFWKHSPWLDEEAAQYIASLEPGFVGIDFQTEKPKEKDFVVHKTLTAKGMILCEYLVNLDKITEDCLFMALPIHLPELEASPVRASAVRFVY